MQQFVLTIIPFQKEQLDHFIDLLQGLLTSASITCDEVDRRDFEGKNHHPIADLQLKSDFDLLDNLMVRKQLWHFADQNKIDIGLQPFFRFHQEVKLAAFDMDSTLLQAEVIDELAVEHGVAEGVKRITESAMRGELDFQQSFRNRMGMLKGLEESAVQKVWERLPLMDGAKEAFAFFTKHGIRTAILSGGFDVFAKEVQSQLGIQDIVANKLKFEAGRLTGQVVEPIVDAKMKAEQLKKLANQEGISLDETLAVGDGANDLLMLKAAGRGIAFRAKPKVRASTSLSIQHHGLEIIPGFLSPLQLSSK